MSNSPDSRDLKPIVLAPAEESPLLWFFSRGQTISERSTSGPMHENHGMYARDAIMYENALRTGRERLPSGERFERLGQPELEYGMPMPEAILNRAGDIMGHRDGETVEITAETVSGTGHEPNHEEMTRWAEISRLLRSLFGYADGGRFLDILSVFFGAEGERWNALQQTGERCFRGHGRIAALYASTSAGRRLLEWADELREGRGQPPSSLSVQERMEEQVRDCTRTFTASERKNIDRGRHKGLRQSEEKSIRNAMIERARREAEPELWAALHAWRAVYAPVLAELEAKRAKRRAG